GLQNTCGFNAQLSRGTGRIGVMHFGVESAEQPTALVAHAFPNDARPFSLYHVADEQRIHELVPEWTLSCAG
ncbi:MAG: hypothetical protein AB2807_03220, partial [Candidatus Sedimenticola endophacoides]